MNYQDEINKQIKPLQESMTITEQSLDQAKNEYNRLLKAYLAADDFEQSLMADNKKILSDKIRILQNQYDTIKEKLDGLQHNLTAIQRVAKLYGFFGSENIGTYSELIKDAAERPNEQAKQVYIDDSNPVYKRTIEELQGELTFEQKLDYIKKYHVTATLSHNGKEERFVTLKCDLKEELLPLMHNSMYT